MRERRGLLESPGRRVQNIERLQFRSSETKMPRRKTMQAKERIDGEEL